MEWQELALQVAAALVPMLTLLLSGLVATGMRYLRTKSEVLRRSQTVAAVEEALLSLIAEADALVVRQLKAGGKWTAETGEHVKRDVVAGILAQLTAEQRVILAGVTSDVEAWLGARLQLLLDQHRSETVAKVGALANPSSPLAAEVVEQLG